MKPEQSNVIPITDYIEKRDQLRSRRRFIHAAASTLIEHFFITEWEDQLVIPLQGNNAKNNRNAIEQWVDHEFPWMDSDNYDLNRITEQFHQKLVEIHDQQDHFFI